MEMESQELGRGSRMSARFGDREPQMEEGLGVDARVGMGAGKEGGGGGRERDGREGWGGGGESCQR